MKNYTLFDKDYPTAHVFQLIYTQEDFLENEAWVFRTHDGSIYHMHTSEAIVNQILVRDADHIYRFIRVRFTDLEVNLQGQGWVKVKDQVLGFPGIYTYENERHKMNLYICEEVYDEDEEEWAFRHVKDSARISLNNVTNDLIGEGWI